MAPCNKRITVAKHHFLRTNLSLPMTNIYTFFPPGKALGLIVLFLFLHSITVFAQDKFTISGTITDQTSGEYLIGATIRDVKSGKGTVTNTFGFYSLTLPSDTALITITYIGYKPGAFEFFLNKNTTQNMALEPGSVLKEVEIKADRYERIEERAQMGRIDVPIQQIKNVPALLGEKDVLKALQLLPGVSGGGEGQSGRHRNVNIHVKNTSN